MTQNYYSGWVGGRRTDQVGIIPTQPSLAGVGAGAELGKKYAGLDGYLAASGGGSDLLLQGSSPVRLSPQVCHSSRQKHCC